MDLKKISNAIKARQIRITEHADEEAQSDNLKYDEIYYSVTHGEIIEEYGDDKPFPSCLVYGRTHKDHPVHSVWAYNAKKKWAVLITVYRPDPRLWIDYKTRKKKI